MDKYKKGEEPWNKWKVTYICKQCGKHAVEKPSAKLLAALDTMAATATEELTEGHMLMYALNGMMPASVAHQCDMRAVGMAEICGVIRDGSNIVVVSG
jgi:hypothetical protein